MAKNIIKLGIDRITELMWQEDYLPGPEHVVDLAPEQKHYSNAEPELPGPVHAADLAPESDLYKLDLAPEPKLYSLTDLYHPPQLNAEPGLPGPVHAADLAPEPDLYQLPPLSLASEWMPESAYGLVPQRIPAVPGYMLGYVGHSEPTAFLSPELYGASFLSNQNSFQTGVPYNSGMRS